MGLEIEDYDIPMDDYKISDEIRKMFIIWVTRTLDLRDNYQIIKKHKNIGKNKKTFKMGISNNDKYLVFNYTHVLQNIYGIQPCNIHYVHGECTGSEEDQLIFGHGNKKRMLEIKNIIDDYDRRSLYQSQRTNQLEYECLLTLMQNLEKDVNRCKFGTKMFYDSFPERSEIINVYGMSLGDVDYPYFKQIRDRWPETKWSFSYYSKKDEYNIKVFVKKMAIPDSQYITFKFDNPIFWKIKDEIVTKIGLTTYDQVKANNR